MAYQRKTRDRWDIMTNYGYGWECENSEYTRADARLGLPYDTDQLKDDFGVVEHCYTGGGWYFDGTAICVRNG